MRNCYSVRSIFSFFFLIDTGTCPINASSVPYDVCNCGVEQNATRRVFTNVASASRTPRHHARSHTCVRQLAVCNTEMFTHASRRRADGTRLTVYISLH